LDLAVRLHVLCAHAEASTFSSYNSRDGLVQQGRVAWVL